MCWCLSIIELKNARWNTEIRNIKGVTIAIYQPANKTLNVFVFMNKRTAAGSKRVRKKKRDSAVSTRRKDTSRQPAQPGTTRHNYKHEKENSWTGNSKRNYNLTNVVIWHSKIPNSWSNNEITFGQFSNNGRHESVKPNVVVLNGNVQRNTDCSNLQLYYRFP